MLNKYLFTTYWKSKNIERQKELDLCLIKNLNDNNINHIYLFSECKMENSDKLTVIEIKEMPKYSVFFNYINTNDLFKNSINIIANSDIFFDNTLLKVEEFFPENKKTALALTRHNFNTKTNKAEIHHSMGWSQDTWIFKGQIDNNLICDFQVGVKGCDNRLAFELHRVGYNVINPAHKLKTYHLHETGYRTYTKHRPHQINQCRQIHVY